MSWGSAVTALLVASVAVAGCAPGPVPHITIPVQTQQHGLAPLLAGVLVVPASSHVTGVYPTACKRAAGEGPELPAHVCTPGALRSDVDPAHLELTVCKPGWSQSIRPPTTETNRMKTAAMLAYGVPEALRPVTELDHEIPEWAGGASDEANLWPEVSDEPGKGIHNRKDEVESRVHNEVCAQTDPVVRARAWAVAVIEFAIDWTKVETVLGQYLPPS